MMSRSVVSVARSPTIKHNTRRMLSTAIPDTTGSSLYESCEDYEILDVRQYLLDVEEAVKPRPMKLNETHRKCMLRTLTGIRDIDQPVRDLRARLQWEKAILFAQEHLIPLKDTRTRNGQFFQSGLHYSPRPYSHFRTPAKWFSYMAKGREYQGRFLWLLCDIAPESISAYTDAVEVIDDKQVQLSWIQAADFEHKEAAISCAELDFPKPYSVSDGMAIGRRSEARLSTFLEQQHAISDNQHLMILENVLVKPRATKGSGIIVYKALNEGMTTEFDCMVVEREGDCVCIHEVWEAKASIQPVSLYDASVKKASALKTILEDDSVRFILDDEPLRLHKEMPLFGLFGSTLHPPTSAAQRINAFSCQRLLSQDVDAVLEALETGFVMVSKDELLKEVEKLRRVLDRVKPIIAVSRESAVSTLTG